jgi:MerR family transcriptional regulator, copper efflux regulator
MDTGRTTAGNGVVAAGLVPIDEVARQLRIPASTIRYYEQRGLIMPVSRHAGRRWFGQEEIRRLAIIRYWQQAGRMSLDEIGDILAGPSDARAWQRIIGDRIAEITTQIEAMRAAREHLEHVLAHHGQSPPDGCDHFERYIWQPAEMPVDLQATHE